MDKLSAWRLRFIAKQIDYEEIMKTSAIFPAINLSELSTETLKKFAEKYGDHYALEIADTQPEFLPKTVIRVMHDRLNVDFAMLSDGEDTFAVYIPNPFQDVTYTEFFNAAYPYLRDLELFNFDPFDVVIEGMVL